MLMQRADVNTSDSVSTCACTVSPLAGNHVREL